MFSGISLTQLGIILVIVLLIFGTKKLRNIGGDLGGAVKGFKDAMHEGEKKQDQHHKQISGEEPDSPQQERKDEDPF